MGQTVERRQKSMKILMFGRGVISTQYAWAFEKAGHTVEFYVKKGRIAEYGETVSLNIYDARKKLKGVLVNENWKIKLREDLNAHHDYDLIIVSVQHYHFKNAVDFLSDKIGNATVLVFNNIWDEPKESVSKLPANQLVWGFPGAGGGFDEKGVLNGTLWGAVSISTFSKEYTQRDMEVTSLFKSSGFKITEIKDFRSWLFSHFVFNAAMHLENMKYNGMAPLADLQSAKFWRNVISNGKELLPLLKARNVDLKAGTDLKLLNLPPVIVGILMRFVIRFLPSIKQVLTGHSNYCELKSYCKDVVLKAEELKINLPRYEESKNLFMN
jgi:2-dehydropantoate 2-reductase